MKRLIVSADDFGLAPSIDEGIVKAYKEGIVTFINLLPSGPSFESSLRLLKELNLKDIGAHLSLTATRPVTDPGRVPSLVGKDGSFRAGYLQFFPALFSNRIRYDEIRVELKNQLERLKRLDIPITCLTSHEHIHMMPSILKIFIDLASEYRIPFIRYPHNDLLVSPVTLKKILKLLIISIFEKKAGDILRGAKQAHADHFIGLLDSGNLNEEVLIRLLNGVREGSTELVCHPGFLGPELMSRCIFHMRCEGELSALTGPAAKKAVEDSAIELASYSDILPDGGAA